MGFRQIACSVVAAVAGLSLTATSSAARTQDGQPVLSSTRGPLASQMLAPPIAPTDDTPTDMVERVAVLEKWTSEYAEWKAWEERWLGKLEPGWFGFRERRAKPDPPAWLFDDCPDVAHAGAIFTDACQLLAEWQEDYSAAHVRARILAGRTEGGPFTTWWRAFHLDALWLTPNVPASYGVVGIHATLKVVGRWQVFVAPGAILLNVPTPQRTREWVPGTDLGFSYRLLDVTLPGSRQGTLHLNVARAWVLGDSGGFVSQTVDLAGLSVSLK